MNTERHDDADILESAVGEMRRIGDSRGPSPEALERTRAAMRAAAQERPGNRLAERIQHMISHRKLLQIAAVAAVFVVAFAVWMLLPSGGAGGVAFAEVQRQIERTQTMTLTCVAEMKGIKKPVTMKMFFKHPGLMRQEMTVDPDAFMPSDANAAQPATVRAPLTTVAIFDMTKQKGLTLIPGRKQAMPLEFRNLPPEAIDQMKKQDFLGGLKKTVAGEHQGLGEKTLEGHKARGYRCKDADMPQATTDIWVDASTGKPLMAETTIPESLGGMKVTMTDFVLNPELDDSLFDLAVPAGYKAETQAAVDFDVKEEALIQGMGRLVKYCDGVFPKALTPTPELIKRMMELAKEKKISEEEGKEFGPLIQKVMLFQIGAQVRGGEFNYAGEGVKLGDKATPVLWYKAKDAKTYRVIYGDLRVEDAEAAPKRPASRPATQPASSTP